jgi:hypothetical protein
MITSEGEKSEDERIRERASTEAVKKLKSTELNQGLDDG